MRSTPYFLLNKVRFGLGEDTGYFWKIRSHDSLNKLPNLCCKKYRFNCSDCSINCSAFVHLLSGCGTELETFKSLQSLYHVQIMCNIGKHMIGLTKLWLYYIYIKNTLYNYIQTTTLSQLTFLLECHIKRCSRRRCWIWRFLRSDCNPHSWFSLSFLYMFWPLGSSVLHCLWSSYLQQDTVQLREKIMLYSCDFTRL